MHQIHKTYSQKCFHTNADTYTIIVDYIYAKSTKACNIIIELPYERHHTIQKQGTN